MKSFAFFENAVQAYIFVTRMTVVFDFVGILFVVFAAAPCVAKLADTVAVGKGRALLAIHARVHSLAAHAHAGLTFVIEARCAHVAFFANP